MGIHPHKMVILLQITHHRICNYQAKMQPYLYNFLFKNCYKKIYNYKKNHCNHAFFVIRGEENATIRRTHVG